MVPFRSGPNRQSVEGGRKGQELEKIEERFDTA